MKIERAGKLREERFIIKVVEMHYKQGLSQQEIGKKLNVSRTTISRALAQAKKQQLEMLNKKIAKMELERSRQTQSWNSERQMAKASNAYDANIMMEAELVKNITKGENNGNFK
jgi:DNA-binding transcriptional regulator LsrR (DeoR family)